MAIVKDLGMVTAYAYAVAGGYEGTEAEFTEMLGQAGITLEQLENLTTVATTLSEGSEATASYSEGVLTFGIPRGNTGATGPQGPQGVQGETGNGIASITKTDTSGLVDTYTITFTDGTTTTFTVTNGADGDITNVAQAFDATKAYSVGDMVLYQGTLYAFTAAHPAGAWVGSDAQAVILADEVTSLKSDLSDVEEAITIVTDYTSDMISGYYIYTNKNIGETIDITPVQNAGFMYIILPCKKGDVFTITTRGGTNPKAWCLTDTNYKLLSLETVATVTDKMVSVSQDGYIIVNSVISVELTPKVIKSVKFNAGDTIAQIESIQVELDDIVNGTPEHITNPHLLFWKMGALGQSGPQTGVTKTRMYTYCKVKAGSKFKAPSTGLTKLAYGYKIDESSSTLDVWNTYSYINDYVVLNVDCYLYIGVLLNNAPDLYNDSLLNNIDIDLIVEHYESKYRKSRAFGNIPVSHYVGQHTDETGWTLATNDVDAIHTAFDALVTASDGWLTKTDLGISYDTYHMYQYDTNPIGLHAAGGFDIPKIAIVCCEHGNEKMSAYAMHYLMYDLIHNPSKNPILYYLRSNCAISFIPIANPWGFINRSRWNENGVNLNRNFPTYNWDTYSDETSGPGGINYKGTAPASEEQTKQIIQFLRNNYDAVFAIDLHTNGEDTNAWYEIATAILNADAPTSPNYSIQQSYVVPSKIDINYIKSWMDENYGSALGNVFYGDVTFPEADRPTTGNWVRESNNMIGITYEVLAGSSNNYLGTELGKYAPATIKAAAEELGDYIVAMIINCKEQ